MPPAEQRREHVATFEQCWHDMTQRTGKGFRCLFQRQIEQQHRHGAQRKRTEQSRRWIGPKGRPRPVLSSQNVPPEIIMRGG